MTMATAGLLLETGRIRGAHDRVDRTYQPTAFAADDDVYRVVGQVALGFDVYKDDVRYRLVGSVTGALELACSRCLVPFVVPVEAAFDLRYVPFDLNQGEGEREIEEDDLATAYYRDEVIDLGQMMREQFYLSLPMKPLCADDCRGLCPVCGVNLNQVACTCRQTWDDPRFAALRALRRERD